MDWYVSVRPSKGVHVIVSKLEQSFLDLHVVVNDVLNEYPCVLEFFVGTLNEYIADVTVRDFFLGDLNLAPAS